MNLPLFIARRMYSSDGHRQEVSRPAIRIATVGVAIGLAVMIITVSVILGFKHTIRDKVVGFGSHIRIESFMAQQTASPMPICINDTLMRRLKSTTGVKSIALYSMTQGILKTQGDFMGVAIKGVGKDYDLHFLQQHLVEGKMPAIGKDNASYELLLSRMIADKLSLKTGERIFAYFLGNDDVRVRKFTISGIYETNMTQFDQMLCFTDHRIPVRLNGWEQDQCSGAEIIVSNFDQLNEVAREIQETVNHEADHYGEALTSQTIIEAYPQIFQWLELLDINVWIILTLMVCVAGFTMISGLLIIILERTQMIGMLKALGARNAAIRHTFLWFAVFIISRGLILGNLLGVGLVILQQQTGFIRLDPANYYVDRAPMELNWTIILALNAATLIICILVLIAPSFLISHIHPARSMRYE